MANIAENFFSGGIESTAIDFAKKKSIAKEWFLLILGLIVAKFATNAASIYGGYWFFLNYLKVFNQFGPVLSIVALLLIEIFAVTAILKAGKFATKGRWGIAAASLVAALLVYVLSFYVSTNGWANREAGQIDATVQIAYETAGEAEAINARHATQIAALNELIQTEKSNPQGWTNGQRSTLLAYQLENIKQYQAQITAVEAGRKLELSELGDRQAELKAENETVMQATASKYYALAAGIMILQIIATFTLAVFYVKIYAEKKEQAYQAEKLAELNRASHATAQNKYIADYSQNMHDINLYADILEPAPVKVQQPAPTQQPTKEPMEEPIQQPVKEQANGHAVPKAYENRIYENRKAYTTGDNISNANGEVNAKLRTCLHCSEPYTYKHHKQMYCCDSCRVSAYESRTGRSLILKPKKA
jgi:hypothetical protein